MYCRSIKVIVICWELRGGPFSVFNTLRDNIQSQQITFSFFALQLPFLEYFASYSQLLAKFFYLTLFPFYLFFLFFRILVQCIKCFFYRKGVVFISTDNSSSLFLLLFPFHFIYPWIVTLHGFKAPVHSFYKYSNILAFSISSKVICNSHALSSFISESFSVPLPLVIYNTYPSSICDYSLHSPTPLPHSQSSPIHLVHIANMYSHVKGHLTSIDISSCLRNKNVKHILHLVGDGVLRNDLEKYVFQLGLSDCVAFHGSLTPQDISLLLRSVHFGLMPSSSEAFGIASIELMSNFTPVIATDVPGQNEIILPGYNGYTFPVGDSDTATQLILQCISSPLAYSNLCHAAFQSSLTYHPSINSNAYITLFNSLLA